jgi:hypothetical protein
VQDDPLDQHRRALLPDVGVHRYSPLADICVSLSDKFLSCKCSASGP